MRPGVLAVPALALLASCSPVRSYQEAARSLRFTLVRVEPSLRLTLPPERSRAVLKAVLEVRNPSDTTFHLLGFRGDLGLATGGSSFQLGQLDVPRPMDLPAGGKAELQVELSLGFQELRSHWLRLEEAASGRAPATWTLDGTLRLEVLGVALSAPVHTRRETGGAP